MFVSVVFLLTISALAKTSTKMKGLLYFAIVAFVQASLFSHSSHSHSRSHTHSHLLQTTDSTNCKTYVVKSGDTCASIGRSTGVTWAQLLSWNREINSKCSYVTVSRDDENAADIIDTRNLPSLANKSICVSNPSGSYAIPISTASSSNQNSSSKSGSVVTTIAYVCLQYMEVSLVLMEISSPVPTPTVDGTNPHCAEYHKVQKNETCATVEKKFGISKSDL